jgi:clan AA aspartic protease (TIGR02281 family)
MRVISLPMLLMAVFMLARVGQAREWTSSDGKYRVEADLAGIGSETVRLKKKADGKVVAVPLKQLCAADQQWIAQIVRQQEAAKGALEKKGIRAVGDGLQVPEELELKSGLRDLPKLKKTLMDSGRQLANARKLVDENKAAMIKLVEANRQFNTQLAMVGPNQVTLNNKLVGAIRANEAQLLLMQQRGANLETQSKNVRAKANEVRERFLETVLKLRKLADGITAKYEESSKDPDIVAAVAQLNQAVPRSFVLGESRSLTTSIRQIEKLEEQIFSESISLRSEGGTMFASVVIDGQHTHEMVVDSGASLISLPAQLAAQCGIQASASDPTIILGLADGSRIPGKLVTIQSVRVGRFTVENVECAILGPQAVNAEPLLGMSFLENFKFEIDAQNSTMTLIEIASDGKKPGR